MSILAARLDRIELSPTVAVTERANALKAAARDNLNEFALAANTESTGTSSWLVALRAPGLFLFVKPDPFVIGGTPLPAADTSAGLIHPTQAALDAFDVQMALG